MGEIQTRDGDVLVGARTPIPLETLFTFPFFWKPSTVVTFLKAAHNFIKGEPQDDRISEFKTLLVTSSDKALPKHGNWKETLGDKHYAILTTRSKRGIYSHSVIDLLGVIRNKYEHSNEFSEEEKMELGWFSDTRTDVPDDHLIVEYWTKRFPKLVMYLWLKFSHFKNDETFKDYYPNAVNPAWLMDVVEFTQQFCSSLVEHLDQGGLAARHMVNLDGNEHHLLEFRTLSIDLQQNILSGSCSMELNMAQDEISLKWYDTRKQSSVAHTGNPDLTETVNVVISNGSREAEEEMFRRLVANLLTRKVDRFVFFTSKRGKEVDSVVGNFLHFAQPDRHKSVPITWADISSARRKYLEKNGEIKLQGREIKLKDVLPKDNNKRHLLLSRITGAQLNQLLRNEKPEIVLNPGPPKLSNNYVGRRLLSREMLGSKIFHTCPENDVFIVTNIEKRKFITIVFPLSTNKYKIHTIDKIAEIKKFSLHNLGRERVIFLVANDFENSREAFQKLKYDDQNKTRVHLLRFVQLSTFQWIASNGSFSLVKELFSSACSVTGTVEEADLLTSVKFDRRDKQMIFISDTAAMGKSQVLISLARQMLEEFTGKVVLFFTMQEFIKLVHKSASHSKQLKRADIIESFTQLCCPDGEFESSVLKHWLNKKSSSRFMFEILFDGLDEVELAMKDFSLAALKVIRNELPIARVWVSMRDHMLDDIVDEFGCLGYKLDPFSISERVDFLQKHWAYYWQKSDKSGPFSSSQDIKNFATYVIAISGIDSNYTISDSPLVCKMLAEIYEDKVLAADLTYEKPSTYSLLELYARLVERKLEMFVRVKNELLNIQIDSPIVNTFREEMERAHIYFALNLVASTGTGDEFRNRLLITANCAESIHAVILQQGLIDNLVPLAFIHRTLAEYFSVLFAANVISGKYLLITEMDSAFQRFLWHDVLSHSIIKNTSKLSNHYQFKLHSPNLTKFFTAMWNDKLSNKLLFPRRRHFVFKIMTRYFERNAFVKPEDVYMLKPILSLYARRTYGRNPVEAQIQFPTISEKVILRLFIASLCLGLDDIAEEIVVNDTVFNPQHLQVIQMYSGKKKSVLHSLFVSLSNCRQWPKLPKFSDTVRKVLKQQQLLWEKQENKPRSAVELKDSKGQTALMILIQGACRKSYNSEYLELLNYFLITAKADVNATDVNGNHALHPHFMFQYRHRCNLAQWDMHLKGYLEMLEQLRRHGHINLDATNAEGNTILLNAIQYFWRARSGLTIDIVKWFKRHGADFRAKNNKGDAAFHLAIQADINRCKLRGIQKIDLQFFQCLLDCGAEVIAVNDKGQYPLHLAVERGRLDLVTLLYNAHPDAIRIADKDGKTVLQYETSKGVHKFLSSLRRFVR